MSIKISQLPNVSILKNSDLAEVSQDIGSGLYTSSNASYQQIADFVSIYQAYQVGEVSGSLFSGNPKIYEVALATPYQNLYYIINVTGEDPRLWTIFNKTTSSFTISSNSNMPFFGYVYWRTNKI